jgi:hypothetical protein
MRLPELGIRSYLVEGLPVPKAERHAGQDDELLEPGSDLRMGISYDTETRFKCARSPGFRHGDSLSCVEESLLCQRIAVVLMRASVSFPWRSCSISLAFCTG